MSVLTAFKKFALRGNMVDLAIAFTVGAAFTTVVKALVEDVIMPPVSLLTGHADFADRFWILSSNGATVPEGGFQTLERAESAGAITLNYGSFINNCLSLAIVAIVMFLIVCSLHRFDEKLDAEFGETPPSSEPLEKKCDYCRSTIAYRASRCPACTSELAVLDVVRKDGSMAGTSPT